MNMNIQMLLQSAVLHQQSGKMDEAEKLYRQILQSQPAHPEANHNLGVLYLQMGQPRRGLPYLKKAVEARPQHPMYWVSRAQGLLAAGQAATARSVVEEAMRRGLQTPQLAELHRQMGSAGAQGAKNARGKPSRAISPVARELDALERLLDEGRHAEVEQRAAALVARYPNLGKGWYLQGLSLLMRQMFPTALAPLLQAAKLLPDQVDVLWMAAKCHAALEQHTLALPYYRRAVKQARRQIDLLLDAAHSAIMAGSFEDGLAFARDAVALEPNNVTALITLGVALRNSGQDLAGAIEVFRRAVTLQPSSDSANYNLGVALYDNHDYEAALRSFGDVLRLNARFCSEAHLGIFNVHMNMGRLEEALASFARADALSPPPRFPYHRKLFALNYLPDVKADDVFAEYQEYERRFASSLYAEWKPHDNGREPERRLKVGYVSADFRKHSARHFIEPLLVFREPAQVETWAYSEVAPAQEDAVTARFRELADHWVPIHGLDDNKVAERIRADGIDILVDLSGHTKGNRLPVFARKPAPVSVSWLGYGYTTGLRAIDWFLTDSITVPQGYDHLFAERPWRMEGCALAYQPATGMGPVSALPANEHGYVTFGSLSRVIRLNEHVIRAWSGILNRVPGSRLILNSKDFRLDSIRQRTASQFAAHGIDVGRLEMGFTTPPWDVLRGMDITLDCFPHNSGTTLFESAYMGVPFITLKDRPSVGRLGTSIATALGHPEWSADSEEEYIEKAVAMASDLEGLARLRATLRGEMEASPLMDEKGFARRVEEAYRQMWRQYCAAAQ